MSLCFAVSVMGHVVTNAMRMIGLSKTPRTDAELREHLDHLADLTAKSPQLTDRERLHVKAVQQLADGYCDPYAFIILSFVTVVVLAPS